MSESLITQVVFFTFFLNLYIILRYTRIYFHIRAAQFGVVLDDISITHLTFGR